MTEKDENDAIQSEEGLFDASSFKPHKNVGIQFIISLNLNT